MGKKRYIDSDFWTDSWVVDNLNPLDCHLFMYLLTNPQTNLAGVYQLSLRIMSFQIGIEREELIRMLKRLEPKVLYRDGWVVLTNSIKNQNYKNEKINKAIVSALEKVPADLVELLNIPDDFGFTFKAQKELQQKLVMQEFDVDVNSQSVEIPTTVDKKSVIENSTDTPDLCPIHETSYFNCNCNTNSHTAVGTTGQLDKKVSKQYFEVNVLYEDLGDLVNDKFKAWYCQTFYKIGREKVMILASQARADGNDSPKLFSKLLREAVK